MNPRSSADLGALAMLTEPVRRRLFDHVLARHPHPVSRDEAASAANVSRKLAAFHLDRLVAAGLLKAGFGRIGARSGPGAGRPSKLYSKADRELRVLLPERRYDFAAGILARAAEDPHTRRRVQEEARLEGEAIGRAAHAGDGEGGIDDLLSVLEVQGFDPVVVEGAVRLRNCPFHGLARQHSDLVCGMNLSLMQGLVAGSGAQVSPRLDRQDGYCCVSFALVPEEHHTTPMRMRLPGWARLGKRRASSPNSPRERA